MVVVENLLYILDTEVSLFISYVAVWQTIFKLRLIDGLLYFTGYPESLGPTFSYHD